MLSTVTIITILMQVSCSQRMEDNQHCQCMPLHMCKNPRSYLAISDESELCETANEVCCENYNLHSRVERATDEIPTENLGCGLFHSIASPTSAEQREHSDYGEQPWAVALYTTDGKYSKLGALVHRRAIVSNTLGGDRMVKAVAGIWNISAASDGSYQVRRVNFTTVHPHFNFSANDIAIHLVEVPFDLTINLNIICIPNSIFDLDIKKCIATGWGRLTHYAIYPPIFKKIEMSLIFRKECMKTAADRGIEMSWTDLCAKTKLKKDLCRGDGGAPLTCPLLENGAMALLGIHNFAIENCKNDFPGYFTDILVVSSWIYETLPKYV